MATVDQILERWRASGYAPRPPAPAEEREDLLRFAREGCGLEPPADYVRFLELCDGGQYDASWFFGCTARTASHLDTAPVFAIGDSGNVDVYVLRPDGSAEIVSLGDLSHVFERYPSFTALLDHCVGGDQR